MGVYAPYPRKDTFTPLIKTPKEILAMEIMSFPEPPPLIGTPKKQNLNKFCDYHGDRGHNTNNFYQLKKQIEEAVASGKLAHLVKDIRRNNQRNGNQGRNGVNIINMIREEGNRKRPFEEGRPIMRSLKVVGSTIHYMIKFPTNQGVVTIETSRETLRECKHLERLQGSWKEVQWHQRKEQMSRIREQAILRARSNSGRRPGLSPVSLEKTRSKEDIEEVFTISHERLDQYVTMGATLTTNCKQLLTDILWENMEVFTWTGSESTAVPRFVMEH
ncbi:hypothetical protein Tco_0044864 [Tanacetum coccineum]